MKLVKSTSAHSFTKICSIVEYSTRVARGRGGGVEGGRPPPALDCPKYVPSFKCHFEILYMYMMHLSSMP